QDRVAAAISGSYSGPSRAAAPVFQQNSVPLVAAYATHPEITTAGDMVFRVIYLSTVQGKAIGQYATGKLGYKRLHVLHIDNDYGNTMSDALDEFVIQRGGTIVSDQVFSPDATDFSAALETINATPADAIILLGYYAQSIEIIKQARALGINLPIVGSDGLDSPKLVELGGKDVEGVVLATDFSRNDPRPVVVEFIRDFRTAYAVDPDVVASSSYDATTLLIDAIKRAGSTDAKAIRDALAATTAFEGVTGNIVFTPEREVNKTILFVKIQNGTFVFQDKIDPADLP
ncbi:MAG TPA: ABC transporter substrate-binding protein, partial [Herpetosiphonaceae bacterium]|nr:ABC transporter substrate-binding protein [Herpetosiphonaceae bacterium]